MNQLPDAPWIRDAELNGYPSNDPVRCPFCGEECDTLFKDRYGELFACDRCLGKVDAYEWAEDQRMEER